MRVRNNEIGLEEISDPLVVKFIEENTAKNIEADLPRTFPSWRVFFFIVKIGIFIEIFT